MLTWRIDSSFRFGLTAMHVVTAVPINQKNLEEQCTVVCPGHWDVMSHIDEANRASTGDPSDANFRRLRHALNHLASPNIVGTRLYGRIGVDRFGYREDWALVRISPECYVLPNSTTPRWDDKDILEEVQGCGIPVSSLEMKGYRDPVDGEKVFSDGARSGFTCGVIGAEMTTTYEKNSIWPDLPENGPKHADTCKQITIWPHVRGQSGALKFGALKGDSGSALFGGAANGDGIEFVGLLISA